MSTAACRSGRCACATRSAATDPAARNVRQRTQIGRRNSEGLIVWDLTPCNSWVTRVWADHIKALHSDPEVTLGWMDGWLVHRTTKQERSHNAVAVSKRLRFEILRRVACIHAPQGGDCADPVCVVEYATALNFSAANRIRADIRDCAVMDAASELEFADG